MLNVAFLECLLSRKSRIEVRKAHASNMLFYSRARHIFNLTWVHVRGKCLPHLEFSLSFKVFCLRLFFPLSFRDFLSQFFPDFLSRFSPDFQRLVSQNFNFHSKRTEFEFFFVIKLKIV